MRALFQKPRVRTAGYVAFGIASFVLFLYLTFPAQAIGQWLSQRINRASNGAVSVVFTDVSLYRFTGIETEKVVVRVQTDGDAPLELEVDGIYARLRVLPLFLLRWSVAVGVKLGTGWIDGVVARDGTGLSGTIEIDAVDVMKPPILSRLTGLMPKDPATLVELLDPAPMAAKFVGVMLKARLDGRLIAKLRWGAGKGKAPGEEHPVFLPDQSEGEATLTLQGVGLGPGTVSGFTIPETLDFGQIELGLDLRRGRLRVSSFKQQGGQVALDLSASSNLRAAVTASSLDACLKFKVTDEAYLTKNPKISTALQLAAVQLKKDPEGFLHLKLAGTLAHPRRQNTLCRGKSGP